MGLTISFSEKPVTFGERYLLQGSVASHQGVSSMLTPSHATNTAQSNHETGDKP